MSGAWESMLDAEAAMTQIREDHGLTEATYETRRFDRVKHRVGVSWQQGYRLGFWDAVEWLLNLQRRVDDLTVTELCAELAKEAGSVYWPLFEADPTFPADCPSRAHTTGQILLDKSGVCPDCGYDFMEDR